jgi:hypothetical protein
MANKQIKDLNVRSDVHKTDKLIVQSADDTVSNISVDALADETRFQIMGWGYRSDNGLDTTPLSVDGDTWTQLTNDGASSSSATGFLADGITRVFDTSTGQVKLDQLSLASTVLFRVGLEMTPSVNNTLVSVRLNYNARDENNDILYSFQQDSQTSELAESGAGTVYNKIFIIPVYVGDENSRRGEGYFEVHSSAALSVNDVKILSIISGGA